MMKLLFDTRSEKNDLLKANTISFHCIKHIKGLCEIAWDVPPEGVYHEAGRLIKHLSVLPALADHGWKILPRINGELTRAATDVVSVYGESAANAHEATMRLTDTLCANIEGTYVLAPQGTYRGSHFDPNLENATANWERLESPETCQVPFARYRKRWKRRFGNVTLADLELLEKRVQREYQIADYRRRNRQSVTALARLGERNADEPTERSDRAAKLTAAPMHRDRTKGARMNEWLVGIRLRKPDGSKFAVSESREGLFLPDGLPQGGRLMICEGPTDTAAMLDLGFQAIGRPSCRGGTKHVVELTRRLAPAVVVIVADGDRPGRDGAEQLTGRLAAYCPAIRVIGPPDGINDARAWKQAGATSAEVEAAIDSAPIRQLQIEIKRIERRPWITRTD